METSKILVDYSKNISRKPFAPEDCQELAANIAQVGQIQPVLVKKIDHPDYEYQLAVGYRRWVATTVILGWDEIKVEVVDENDDRIRLMNFSENLFRKDATFWEQCCAMRAIYPPETTAAEIARSLGKSRNWVRTRWLIWKMPTDVVAQIEAGLLSSADVSLLIAHSMEEQQAAAQRIIDNKAKGNSTQSIHSELSRRKTTRPKKEVHAMMTCLMEKGMEREIHCLRWAIGEISDTQLLDLLS